MHERQQEMFALPNETSVLLLILILVMYSDDGFTFGYILGRRFHDWLNIRIIYSDDGFTIGDIFGRRFHYWLLVQYIFGRRFHYWL